MATTFLSGPGTMTKSAKTASPKSASHTVPTSLTPSKTKPSESREPLIVSSSPSLPSPRPPHTQTTFRRPSPPSQNSTSDPSWQNPSTWGNAGPILGYCFRWKSRPRYESLPPPEDEGAPQKR